MDIAVLCLLTCASPTSHMLQNVPCTWPAQSVCANWLNPCYQPAYSPDAYQYVASDTSWEILPKANGDTMF